MIYFELFLFKHYILYFFAQLVYYSFFIIECQMNFIAKLLIFFGAPIYTSLKILPKSREVNNTAQLMILAVERGEGKQKKAQLTTSPSAQMCGWRFFRSIYEVS